MFPLMLQNSFLVLCILHISSGKSTKVMIVSTPHGMNMFYKLWTDAETKKTKLLYTYRGTLDGNEYGRDDKWKKETIANTSEQQFQTEFECEVSWFYRHTYCTI